MADKYHSDTQEKIDSIVYYPNLQDSGDLEASTNNITVTSKQGLPDYTINLTTTAPSDARLAVTKLCQRLNIYIDSFGGGPAATKLYYSVEVNGVERASGEFIGTGADNPDSWGLSEGQFNLDSANQVDVFLWVDQGNAVVSACQLWQAVGQSAVSYDSAVELQHTGLVTTVLELAGVGTGTPTIRICPWEAPVLGAYIYYKKASGVNVCDSDTVVAGTGVKLAYYCSVASDIAYSRMMVFHIRSMQ